MVLKAFAMLDKSGNGVITVADIVQIYDVSMNPDFLERRATKEQILNAFLNNFEGPRGNKDGSITL